MGNKCCCPDQPSIIPELPQVHQTQEKKQKQEKQDKSVLSPSESKIRTPLVIVPVVDGQSTLFKKYKVEGKNHYSKIEYGWHHLPLVNKIDWSVFQQLTIQIVAVKNNNFLVGLINQESKSTRTPWQTKGVVCLQAHNSDGECAFFMDGKGGKLKMKGIQNGSEIKVRIDQNTVTWLVNKVVIKEMRIEDQFKKDKVYPYVCLWNSGDIIRFIQ